ISDLLAVFLDEGALLGRQEVEHSLRRTAQLHALPRNDDRSVDQDGVLVDRVEKLIVSQREIAKPKLFVRGALLAEDTTERSSRSLHELSQQRSRRRCLQMLYNMRFDSRIADHRMRVARGPAFGVVVDDHVHAGSHAVAAAETSSFPISRNLDWSDIRSIEASGSARKAEIRFDSCR